MRTRHVLYSALSVAIGVMACSCARVPSHAREGRPFHMGFTSWSYGPSVEAVEGTYTMIRRHADLICFQFDDGVPWPEAYAGKPYSSNLEETIRTRVQHLRKGQKVFLEFGALNMGRDDITGYWGESGAMPMPAPWNTYSIEDERTIAAYSNYCIDVIGRLHADYVNYSLEATDLMLSNPSKWDAFVEFQKGVYTRIKAVFPDVPLGISVPLKHPDGREAATLKEGIGELLPYVDFLGASCYGFVFFGHNDAGNPANLPDNWLSQIKEMAGDKPVAVTETNWIAKDLVINLWNINTRGTEEWQNDYVERMLSEASELNALFVCWWSIADFDRLWETFPENIKDVGRVWRDTGLYDENLRARPSLATWDKWLVRTVVRD